MSSTATIVGNATSDPTLRYTTGGRAVVSFGVAESRRYQVNGDWKEETSFHNVVAWGTLGENVAASIVKGSRVIVTGRLSQRTWETQEGEKRSVVEIVADGIGPDLRWASAVVERNEREEGFKSNQQAGDDLPPEEPPF